VTIWSPCFYQPSRSAADWVLRGVFTAAVLPTIVVCVYCVIFFLIVPHAVIADVDHMFTTIKVVFLAALLLLMF